MTQVASGLTRANAESATVEAGTAAAAAWYRVWIASWRRATLISSAAYGWNTILSGALLASGVLHLGVAPQHSDHAPAHGLFFLALGLIQMGLALAVMRHPARLWTASAIVVAGASIVLWGLSRVLRAPFESHPESVDAFGVAIKAAELATMVAAALYWMRVAPSLGSAERAVRRWIGLLVAVSVAMGLAGYGFAVALEPLLPGLAGPGHAH